MFCNSGEIEFRITVEDLVARRFDKKRRRDDVRQLTRPWSKELVAAPNASQGWTAGAPHRQVIHFTISGRSERI